jgi:hypothetical protein
LRLCAHACSGSTLRPLRQKHPRRSQCPPDRRSTHPVWSCAGGLSAAPGPSQHPPRLELDNVCACVWHTSAGCIDQVRKLDFMLICRNFDATAMTLEFGDLFDELHQCARYRVYDGSRWNLVDYSVAKASRRHVKSGVLDVFGQSVHLHWPSGEGLRSESVLTRLPRLEVVPTSPAELSCRLLCSGPLLAAAECMVRILDLGCLKLRSTVLSGDACSMHGMARSRRHRRNGWLSCCFGSSRRGGKHFWPATGRVS